MRQYLTAGVEVAVDATSSASSPSAEEGPQPLPDPARVRVDLAARVAGVTRLADLGAPVDRMVDIQAVLGDVLRTAVDVVRAPLGSLMLYDAGTQRISVHAVVGFDGRYAEELGRLRPGEGAAGRAMSTGRPVTVEDVATDPVFASFRHLAREHGYRAVYCVPLVTLGNEVMGVITTYFREPHRPAPRDAALVEAYARQAADMVERARLHGEARELAARERRRAVQLRQLADAALDLSAVTTLDDLLATVTESAREIIGTHQGVTSRLPDGSWERAATYVSLSEKYAHYRDFAQVPEGLGVLTYVTRENKPLRLTAEALKAHPDWRGLGDAPGHPPLPDYLAAPLVGRDGSNLGLIQLADKDGKPFTAEDESILVQLAQMASAAVQRIELVANERAARSEAEQLARRHGLLSEAGKKFSQSLEVDDALRTIAHLVVPTLGDFCAIDLRRPDGQVRRLHQYADDSEQGRRLQVLDHRSRREPPHGVLTVLGTGRTELYPSVTDAVVDELAGTPKAAAALRELDVRSALVVPLRARGETIGALTLLRLAGAPYDAGDAALVEELATRAAIAIDNATRYAFERDLASTLQRSLLPQALPIAAGIDVASRYLPGARGTAVGGDWYDLIDLGHERVALVVGDVMGRGVNAATVMGQLRATVRAYAIEGHEPAELLRRLDAVVQALDESQLTTCVYGVYDASTRDLTIATAGHLPPLLIDADGPHFLELEPGLPLGVGSQGFGQTRVPLTPGTTVLLYTDGLIEDPDTPITDGLAALVAAAREAPSTPEGLCDHVLAALGRDGDHDDDTALLAVTLTTADRQDPQAPAELDLPAEPGSAAAARAFVAEALHTRGLDRHRDIAVLLVSELVTNALRHARTAVRVRVASTTGRLRVEVVDGSGQVPLPRHAIPDQDESGRGMLLVAGLSDRWGAEPGFGGKRVWFELDS